MSHFVVIVVGDNWEEQLEKFDENLQVEEYKEFLDEKDIAVMMREYKKTEVKDLVEHMKDWNSCIGGISEDGRLYYLSESNPDGQWDWYVRGGRWTGYFKKKQGAGGELGEPGTFDNKPAAGYVDSIRKGDIDFEGMRKDAQSKAGQQWLERQIAVKDLPAPESYAEVKVRYFPKGEPTWEEVSAKFGVQDPGFDDLSEEHRTTAIEAARRTYHTPYEEARAEYGSQPAIKALRSKNLDYFFGCVVTDSLRKSVEEVRLEEANDCLVPHAVVKDGGVV